MQNSHLGTAHFLPTDPEAEIISANSTPKGSLGTRFAKASKARATAPVFSFALAA